MSKMFNELVRRSRRVSRDEFATDFGGIADDVVEMLNSEQLNEVLQEVRDGMESAGPLPNNNPRLRQVEFGQFSNATELEIGEVAAIDGTYALPIQKYSAGQALCVAVGSLSYRRPMQDSLHYWSSRILLSEASDSDDFIRLEEQGLFGISQTAYLRYFEVKHGCDIEEPYLFLDGTLVYEWLVSSQEGVQLYNKLFESGKQVLGVIKDIKGSPVFAKFARALRTGEIFVVETLQDHLNQSNAPNRNQGESRNRYVLDEFKNDIAGDIFRGVFKPRNKAFGFEVHKDHLETMLRIMAADCQMNNPGHEIPFLLNRIDEEVRENFSQRILKDRIAVQMATHSEELFFEETNERSFRTPL
ncbi:MAG: hypothetical protein OXU36_15575 [Candidatus Poribacteria bacterium]|nr:hypothetical protein [Candidatus Poribacteria bacterium]